MKTKKRYIRWTILAGIVLLAFLCLARYAFTYLNTLVFTERQEQLQEVVSPYFEKIDTVTEQLWRTASALENRLVSEQPTDVEELQAFFEQETSIQNWEEQGIAPIAIRDDGQYLDVDGVHGSLSYTEPLGDCEKRTNFIFEPPYTGKMLSLYVYRLEDPVRIEYKDDVYSIAFVGITQKMENMNQYFRCSSYGNDNSTYILDRYGAKQYVDSSASMNLIEGHNVYGVLRKEYESQGRDFDELLTELNSKGTVYSDVEISGQQCFYAMRKMPNTDFVIIYINPADRVATGTAALVKMVIAAFAIVAVGMGVLVVIVVAVIFTRNQRQLAFETQARQELQKLNNELDKTNMELQQASKAKSEFLANMSHDIRTPMNAIVGITQLMEHEEHDPEKIDTYIHKVQNSSQHLLGLINDILDMSKIESTEVTLNCEEVNLAEQVGQVDSIIRPQAEEHDQSFVVRVHEIVHEYLIGDAVRLRQVIINLLSNAVKYTLDGGMIQFDLAELASEDKNHAVIRITVTDNGYGMTPEFVAHIFEPFTRAENSTTNKVQGTGLGMAITKNIVDMMGGTITVRSEVNKGSCFQVTLPVLIDKAVRHEMDVKKVLLISEDEVLLQNIKASFKESQVSLYEAGTKAEAEQILDDQNVDAILLAEDIQDSQLSDIVQFLRQKAENILMFDIKAPLSEQGLDSVEESSLDGVIYRPFFLSNFVHAVNKVRNEKDMLETEENCALDGMRFMCAEDNELNAEILNALMDVNGAECIIYPDGQKLVEAFASVKPGEYDAILMDVQMPNMNGLEATRAIRNGDNPLGKNIPIIAMTANAFSSDVQECLDAGMDAHVSKPLDIATLERTLRALRNRMTVRRR